jgi:hypothetical protein
MFRKCRLNTLIAASTLSVLAACGGGDAPPPLDPQGIWTGTMAVDVGEEVKTLQTYNVVTLITEDKKLWMFATSGDAPGMPSLATGTGKIEGSTFSGDVTVHDPATMFDGAPPGEDTFKGVIEEETNMRVTVGTDGVEPFFLNAQSDYDTASDVTSLELSSKQWTVLEEEDEFMRFKIDSLTANVTRTAASFEGEYGDGEQTVALCTFTGTITAMEKNYFSITLEASTDATRALPCPDDNKTFDGVGLVRGEDDDRILYIGLETDAGERVIFAPLKIKAL